MFRTSLTSPTVLALCLASCDSKSTLADRVVGQYDFVEARFSITGGASADTMLVAGQGKTFGNLILHPDGKLTSAGSLSGMNAYMTGRWTVEDDELRLVLDSVGSFPGSPTPLPAQLSGRSLTFTLTTTPPTRRREYVVEMRSDLGKLAAAQEANLRKQGRYTPDLRALGFTTSPGVSEPTLAIAGSGYSAIVTHARLPNGRCAVAKSAPNPLNATTRDGEPFCDLPIERDSLVIAYTWRRAS
jgi:hypothetical protein